MVQFLYFLSLEFLDWDNFELEDFPERTNKNILFFVSSLFFYGISLIIYDFFFYKFVSKFYFLNYIFCILVYFFFYFLEISYRFVCWMFFIPFSFIWAMIDWIIHEIYFSSNYFRYIILENKLKKILILVYDFFWNFFNFFYWFFFWCIFKCITFFWLIYFSYYFFIGHFFFFKVIKFIFICVLSTATWTRIYRLNFIKKWLKYIIKLPLIIFFFFFDFFIFFLYLCIKKLISISLQLNFFTNFFLFYFEFSIDIVLIFLWTCLISSSQYTISYMTKLLYFFFFVDYYKYFKKSLYTPYTVISKVIKFTWYVRRIILLGFPQLTWSFFCDLFFINIFLFQKIMSLFITLLILFLISFIIFSRTFLIGLCSNSFFIKFSKLIFYPIFKLINFFFYDHAIFTNKINELKFIFMNRLQVIDFYNLDFFLSYILLSYRLNIFFEKIRNIKDNKEKLRFLFLELFYFVKNLNQSIFFLIFVLIISSLVYNFINSDYFILVFFPEASGPLLYGIVSLHHILMFYLIVILIVVSISLVKIISDFGWNRQPLELKFYFFFNIIQIDFIINYLKLFFNSLVSYILFFNKVLKDHLNMLSFYTKSAEFQSLENEEKIKLITFSMPEEKKDIYDSMDCLQKDVEDDLIVKPYILNSIIMKSRNRKTRKHELIYFSKYYVYTYDSSNENALIIRFLLSIDKDFINLKKNFFFNKNRIIKKFNTNLPSTLNINNFEIKIKSNDHFLLNSYLFEKIYKLWTYDNYKKIYDRYFFRDNFFLKKNDTNYINEILYIRNFNNRHDIEYIWAIIPILIILSIIIPSYILLYSIDENLDPGITLHCIGNQWYWEYQVSYYVDNYIVKENYNSSLLSEEELEFGQKRLLITDEKIILPINVPIRFIMSSADVLHAWAVPEIGIKLDAVPGRLNNIITWFFNLGSFYGQCSELCGTGHGFMPISLEVLPNTVFKESLLLLENTNNEQDIEQNLDQDIEQNLDQDIEQNWYQDIEQKNNEQDIEQNWYQDIEQNWYQDIEQKNLDQDIEQNWYQDIEQKNLDQDRSLYLEFIFYTFIHEYLIDNKQKIKQDMDQDILLDYDFIFNNYIKEYLIKNEQNIKLESEIKFKDFLYEYLIDNKQKIKQDIDQDIVLDYDFMFNNYNKKYLDLIKNKQNIKQDLDLFIEQKTNEELTEELDLDLMKNRQQIKQDLDLFIEQKINEELIEELELELLNYDYTGYFDVLKSDSNLEFWPSVNSNNIMDTLVSYAKKMKDILIFYLIYNDCIIFSEKSVAIFYENYTKESGIYFRDTNLSEIAKMYQEVIVTSNVIHNQETFNKILSEIILADFVVKHASKDVKKALPYFPTNFLRSTEDVLAFILVKDLYKDDITHYIGLTKEDVEIDRAIDSYNFQPKEDKELMYYYDIIHSSREYIKFIVLLDYIKDNSMYYDDNYNALNQISIMYYLHWMDVITNKVFTPESRLFKHFSFLLGFMDDEALYFNVTYHLKNMDFGKGEGWTFIYNDEVFKRHLLHCMSNLDTDSFEKHDKLIDTFKWHIYFWNMNPDSRGFRQYYERSVAFYDKYQETKGTDEEVSFYTTRKNYEQIYNYNQKLANLLKKENDKIEDDGFNDDEIL